MPDESEGTITVKGRANVTLDMSTAGSTIGRMGTSGAYPALTLESGQDANKTGLTAYGSELSNFDVGKIMVETNAVLSAAAGFTIYHSAGGLTSVGQVLGSVLPRT
jgi:hypothetical protein